MSKLRNPRFRVFLDDESGNVIIETVIVLPLLFSAFLAMYVFWDAYQAESASMKATYAIADVISREINDITPAYITGSKTLYDYILNSNRATSMVVSSVTWDPVAKKHIVLWSEARSPDGMTNALPVLGPSSISKFADQIPNIGDGDSQIVVQTRVRYVAVFPAFGLESFDYDLFMPTRPRSTPKVTCPACGGGV